MSARRTWRARASRRKIVEQTRGPKVIAFKKRRRKNSKRKRGHKQLTIVRITGIQAGAEGLAPIPSPPAFAV